MTLKYTTELSGGAAAVFLLCKMIVSQIKSLTSSMIRSLITYIRILLCIGRREKV